MPAKADPTSEPAASTAIGPLPIPPEATEEQLIALWLHGKSPNTIRAYRREIANFRATSSTGSPTSAARADDRGSCGFRAGPGSSCKRYGPPMPWVTIESSR